MKDSLVPVPSVSQQAVAAPRSVDIQSLGRGTTVFQPWFTVVCKHDPCVLERLAERLAGRFPWAGSIVFPALDRIWVNSGPPRKVGDRPTKVCPRRTRQADRKRWLFLLHLRAVPDFLKLPQMSDRRRP